MNEINVYKLTLMKETEVPYHPVSCPDDIHRILVDIGLDSVAEEYFYIICTDAKGHVIGLHEVSHGDLSSSPVHPRELFKRAILNNASAIVLAHNHPSGDLDPSLEDSMTTDRLVKAGDLLGVRVIDHLIVGADGYFSFASAGLL